MDEKCKRCIGSKWCASKHTLSAFCKGMNKFRIFVKEREESIKLLNDYLEKSNYVDWITDEKPPRQEDVLVSIKDERGDRPNYYTSVGWYFDGYWIVDDDLCSFVNGWMPFPKPLIE